MGLCTTVNPRLPKTTEASLHPTTFSVSKKREFASKSDITGRRDP